MIGSVCIIGIIVQLNAYSLESETSILSSKLAIGGSPTVTYITVLELLAGGYA